MAGALVGLLAVCYLATVLAYRRIGFDDSFILYGYAKHLAFGDGQTWNRGEPPTEGSR